MKEVGDLVKHYADVLTSPLPFSHAPRTNPFHRCLRFGKLISVEKGGWYYHGASNEIRFTVDKDIVLHGVQHFGREEGKYEVSIKVNYEPGGDRLISYYSRFETREAGSYKEYTSVKDENEEHFGFDVILDQPIWLKRGKSYEVVSSIIGPDSWYGSEGKTSVECAGVTFEFKQPHRLVTDVSRGQFPALIFSL